MVAAKLVDAMSRLPGFAGENADARKAYTQALLKDHEGNTEIWIDIEESQWPAEWHGKYKRPVVRLVRNLYGHPLAGLWWEKHADTRIRQCGFQKVNGWECLYDHPKKMAYLSVYVDDLKLACPQSQLKGI